MTSPLALLGGTPAVTQPGPHFTWPPVDGQTAAMVAGQLGTAVSIYDRSGIIADLEDQLAGYFGVRHAVLTSSGTAALYDLYAARRIRPGDEVIVPAYGFYATVTPLLHLGAIPVLADCDPNGNLYAADVAPQDNGADNTQSWSRTCGRCPPTWRRCVRSSDAHGLVLFEDASRAHGALIGDTEGRQVRRRRGVHYERPETTVGRRGWLRRHRRRRDVLPGPARASTTSVAGGRSHRPSAVYVRRHRHGPKLRIHPFAARITTGQLDHLDEYSPDAPKLPGTGDKLADLPGMMSAARRARCTRPGTASSSATGRKNSAACLSVATTRHCSPKEPGSRPSRLDLPPEPLPLFQNPGELFPASQGAFAYQPGDFPARRGAPRGRDQAARLAPRAGPAARQPVRRGVPEGLRQLPDCNVTAVLPDNAFTDLARQAAADGIQQLVVGGIVHRDGAVLLLKRPDDDFMGGIWELPSGKAEPGETLDAALTREVIEETGLDDDRHPGVRRQLRLPLRQRQEKPSVQLRHRRGRRGTGQADRARRLRLDTCHRRTARHGCGQDGPA